MPLHTSLATALFLAGSATGKPGLNTIVEDAAVSPMVLFMGGMIKKTETGYHQMNRALKERVENRGREKQI
jgi:hypothetical protein